MRIYNNLHAVDRKELLVTCCCRIQTVLRKNGLRVIVQATQPVPQHKLTAVSRIRNGNLPGVPARLNHEREKCESHCCYLMLVLRMQFFHIIRKRSILSKTIHQRKKFHNLAFQTAHTGCPVCAAVVSWSASSSCVTESLSAHACEGGRDMNSPWRC